MTSSTAEVREEAAAIVGTDDPEAEALLAQMGVEEEGIESGQLLGLVLVVLASVVALAVALIYLLILPLRAQSGRDAEGAAQNYEQATLRTEATAQLGQFSRVDETYGVPIATAMGIVAAEYGASGPEAARQQGYSRADWNLLAAHYGIDGAVQDLGDSAIEPRFPFSADGIEEVGVDRDVETVERIENEPELDADAAEVVPGQLDDIE